MTTEAPPRAAHPARAPGGPGLPRTEPATRGTSGGPPPRTVTPWRTLGWLAGAHLAALAGLHVLIRESAWWWAAAAFTLLVLAATTAARRLVPGWIAAVIGAAAGLGGVTLAFAPDTALVGVVPTFETWGRFREIALSGFQSIAEQRIPATTVPSIVFLIVVLAAVLALLGEVVTVGWRMPALGILPVLGILAVPVVIRGGVANPVVYVITAICLLALLRNPRPRTGQAALAVGVPVVVASLFAPSMLPEIVDDPGAGSGFSSGLNPLVTLGDDLRRGTPVTAATYTSDAGPLYLRLAVMNEFTGRTWAPDPEAGDPDGSLEDFPEPRGLGSQTQRTEHTAEIELGGVSGRWLPLPYPATSVTGLDGDWMWEPEGLSVRSERGNTLGQSYGVSFLDVEPTVDQLRAAGPPGESVRDELALPDEMPDIIAETAIAVTAGLATDYDRALALQSYLRGPDFRYSVETPVEDGYDGSGVDVLATFLEERAGYCTHFSSAMAVMARSLGIPARVAVGFQPGSSELVDGQTTYSVSTHDLHAWPELYFNGAGWVRFEPTPSRGELPAFPDEAAADPDAPAPDDEPSPTRSATPRATSTPGAVAPGMSIDDDPAIAAERANTTAAVSAVIGLVLLLVLITPAVARAGIRWWRLRRIRLGDRPAEAAWDELRDTARDIGWAAPDTETPRVFADRLGIVLQGDRDAILRLRTDVESTAFAPPDRSGVDAEELREVRSAIVRSGSARDRLRAIFLPPSLVARVRFDPDA